MEDQTTGAAPMADEGSTSEENTGSTADEQPVA